MLSDDVNTVCMPIYRGPHSDRFQSRSFLRLPCAARIIIGTPAVLHVQKNVNEWPQRKLQITRGLLRTNMQINYTSKYVIRYVTYKAIFIPVPPPWKMI